MKEKQKTEEDKFNLRSLIVAKLLEFSVGIRLLPKRPINDPSTVRFIEEGFNLSKIRSIKSDIESRLDLFEPDFLNMIRKL